MDGRALSDAEVSEGFARVAAHLEPRLGELAARLTDLYRQEIPSYAEAPAGSVRRGVLAVLQVVLDRVKRGEPPDEHDATQIADYARAWASMQVPLDMIAHSLQLGARELMAEARGMADEAGLDHRMLLEIYDRAWDWATLNSSVLAAVAREQAEAGARRDATRRADFLRDLAAGRVTAERLSDEAAAYGLDLEHAYVAVVARARESLERKLRQAGATRTHRVMQVTVDGRLLALCPQRPTVPAGVTVAVGAPALLRDAHASFAEAEQALATALAARVTGLVDLGSLGALPFVMGAPAQAARLVGRHFTGLDELGRTGAEIEHTVLTLLELDHSVEATATKLHLHRNSVRHRVNRFRELTGLDLKRTDDVVTAWLVLKWRLGVRRTE